MICRWKIIDIDVCFWSCGRWIVRAAVEMASSVISMDYQEIPRGTHMMEAMVEIKSIGIQPVLRGVIVRPTNRLEELN
jgi:hypothetical protein